MKGKDIQTELNARIKSIETVTGRKFTTDLSFSLVKPERDSYYGTGYYLVVKMKYRSDDGDAGENIQTVDVRYTGTTDIKRLSMDFIRSYYGTNLMECSFNE